MIREGLHETLTRVVDAVHDIGAAVHEAFFAAAVRTTQRQCVVKLPTPAPAGMTQTQSQS